MRSIKIVRALGLGSALCTFGLGAAMAFAQEGGAGASAEAKAFGKAGGSVKASAKAKVGGRSTGPAIGPNKSSSKEKPMPAAGDGGAARPGAPAGAGLADAGNVTTSRHLVNGRKILQVNTDSQSIQITEKPSGAVSMLVTTFQPDDAEVIKHYTAGSLEELATKHPDAHRLYMNCVAAAKPKPEDSIFGGLDGTDVDADALMRKARKELEKLRGSDELDDGGRAIIDRALKGLE